MPFKSKDQQKYFYANFPKEVADEWAKKTNFKKLPKKVKKKKKSSIELTEEIIRCLAYLK